MPIADRVASNNVRCYAEIGIQEGNTTLKVAKCLKSGATVYLFDISYWVDIVAARLAVEFPEIKVVRCPNQANLKDSYCWTLMKLLEEFPKHHFDYVYLDGAHTWHEDALAFFLVDKLLNINGIIEFDDYNWTIGNSPTMNPKVHPLSSLMYTDEQLRTAHIKKVVDLLVKTNPNYVEVESNRAFRKVNS